MAHFWEDWADESLYWFEVYFRFMDPAAATKSVALLAAGRPGFERVLLGSVVRRSHKKALHGQGLARMPRERVVAKFCEHLDQLEVLGAAEGGVVSAEQILERAWDENADSLTNAVRITVSALRKRLGEPWLIATVAGVGYRIDSAHRGGTLA